MTGEIIYATIFMAAFVLIGGLVMYLSKTIDAGEARFDSETGKVITDKSSSPPPPHAADQARTESKASDAAQGPPSGD